MLGGARGGGHSVRIERVEDDWRVAGPPSPLYLVAVAGNGELPELPGESSLFDYGLEVLAERQATVETLLQELRERREQLVAAYARAERAELAEKTMRETVAWRLQERIQPLVYRFLGEDTALGRALRRVTTRIYDALR